MLRVPRTTMASGVGGNAGKSHAHAAAAIQGPLGVDQELESSLLFEGGSHVPAVPHVVLHHGDDAGFQRHLEVCNGFKPAAAKLPDPGSFTKFPLAKHSQVRHPIVGYADFEPLLKGLKGTRHRRRRAASRNMYRGAFARISSAPCH